MVNLVVDRKGTLSAETWTRKSCRKVREISAETVKEQKGAISEERTPCNRQYSLKESISAENNFFQLVSVLSAISVSFLLWQKLTLCQSALSVLQKLLWSTTR